MSIAAKPNSLSYERNSQLQKRVDAAPTAGIISEFRKSSPGPRAVGSNSLNRNGQPSAGQRAANAMMNDIQKVVPASREQNPMDEAYAPYQNGDSVVRHAVV